MFKIVKGEAILDFYARADRKWVVTYEPEGKQVRLDVAIMDKMVDSGEWVYQPKEVEELTPATIDLLVATEGDPISKFCCRQCGECAPEELLEEGRFPDRIAWLQSHYKVKHPGMWGKLAVTPITPEVVGKIVLTHADLEDLQRAIVTWEKELAKYPKSIQARDALLKLRKQEAEIKAQLAIPKAKVTPVTPEVTAEKFLIKRYGETALRNAHNAAYISKEGTLLGDLADHQKAAVETLGELGIPVPEDEYTAVKLLQRETGLIRLHVGEFEINIDVAASKISPEQISMIKKLIKEYPTHRFIYDIYDTADPAALKTIASGYGFEEFVDAIKPLELAIPKAEPGRPDVNLWSNRSLTKRIEYVVYYKSDDVDHVSWQEAKKILRSLPSDVFRIERVTRWWYEDGTLEREEEETLYEEKGYELPASKEQPSYLKEAIPEVAIPKAEVGMPAVIPTELSAPNPKQELEFVSDSPEYLAFTIDDIGYREKLDTAFETAIARAKGG